MIATKSVNKLLYNNLYIFQDLKYKNNLYRQLLRYCSSGNRSVSTVNDRAAQISRKIRDGPGLSDFFTFIKPEQIPYIEEKVPYINNITHSSGQKIFFDVYGCQMNVNDTEIVWSILKNNGFIKTNNVEDADVILVITCSIRDNAEAKIWNRLDYLRNLKRRQAVAKRRIKIGILGCMAERLKHQLIEKEQSVDIVAGPDSYKDLPRLLAITENDQTAVNVILSLDETYADVMPVRLNRNSKTAFVSIMRGCDNMCTYCIVPFTRGRERSRPLDSVVSEIKHLSQEGVKEVTLLGQNVNSYRYVDDCATTKESTNLAKGFKTVYKIKTGGLRFADLLDKVSAVDPEMRIRFTSPHPKDFPDEVLQIVKERRNICKSLHLPAQSGNSAVLERMRRGYTREAYLELIEHVRSIIPNVMLSSDFICGFCHETDEEFLDTLSLIEKVKYNVAYLFSYSMREKTTAHRRYEDDVPQHIKLKRLSVMIDTFRKSAEAINTSQVGEMQIVLIEGRSKRSNQMLAGRNDGNIKVIISAGDVPIASSNPIKRAILPGDYVAVRIESANSQVLKGTPLFHTSISSFDHQVSKLKSYS